MLIRYDEPSEKCPRCKKTVYWLWLEESFSGYGNKEGYCRKCFHFLFDPESQEGGEDE